MPAALIALLDVLMGIGLSVGIIALIFGSPKGRAKFAQLLANWLGGAIDAAIPAVDTLADALQPVVAALANSVANHGAPIKDGLESALSSFATSAFNTLQKSLTGKTDITPDQWQSIAGAAFADAASFGLGSYAVTMAYESIFPEKLNTLNSLGPMLGTLAGFEEVTKAALGPLLGTGIAAPSRYDAQIRFRPYVPTAQTALNLSSRRKLTDVDLNVLMDYGGLSPVFRTALNAGKYRPLSARALATLIQDTPFNRAQMQEILEDNAFSPDHVQVMLDLLEYNSTKNVRNSLISQAETAYKAGVISDDEMHQIVTDAGWSDQAWQLVKSKILIERRMTLASEVEKQVIPLIANGNITAEEGLQQLEAAGIQDWYAQLVVTLATTKAEIHAFKIEAAAELKAELARQRNLTRAAVGEFQRGAIDQAGLLAALLLIPLDPTVAASIVSVQDATRAGRLRFVFGQFLTPEDARVLDDRVAAIEGQFKKQLITLDSARAQLNSLSIPAEQVSALLARWAAALVAAGKNAYLLSPLTGLPPT